MALVNGAIVEEVLLPIGQLDFGKELLAKCDVSLWRTRGEHRSLVGEFAFQANVELSPHPARATQRRLAPSIAAKQKRLCADFYVALQHAVADWLALGVTKTAMVYRLNGAAPQSHE